MTRRHLLPLLTRLCFGLALALAPACNVTELAIWKSAPPSPADLFEVQKISGVTYCDGPVSESIYHQMDLYLPKGAAQFPVVVLLHGGAWRMELSDNRCFGLYPAIAELLARQGIGVVVPNYRLSPEFQHPEHIKDVAKAYAWTYANIGKFGGRADMIFLAGHSAGGHLAALLATDEAYLKAEGLSAADIKGVISVSGVYRIPEQDFVAALGGTTPLSLRYDELYPMREKSSGPGIMAALPPIPFTIGIYKEAFGDDPATRACASPINHVRPGLPPFFLVCAENDLPTIAECTEEFHQTLREHGCESCSMRVERRNHDSVVYCAIDMEDPVAFAMVDFIRRHIPAPVR
jgi:acetyl esterase/lipase